MKNKVNSFAIVMIALVLIVLAGLVLGFVAGSAEARKKSHELMGDGYYIYCRKGNNAYMELEGNPTTGFDWYVETVPEGLELVSRKYSPSDKSGKLAGAGGISTICFKARAGGVFTVDLVYKRNWEGGETAKVLSLQVSAVKDSKGRIKINGLKVIE